MHLTLVPERLELVLAPSLLSQIDAKGKQKVRGDPGLYKVPPPFWGKFIKYVGEEYHVFEEVEEISIMAVECTVEKREKGSNVIFPITLRLLGRISSG